MNPHRPVLALALAVSLLAVGPAAALTRTTLCAEEGSTIYPTSQLRAELGSSLPRFMRSAILPQRMIVVGLEKAGYFGAPVEPVDRKPGCFNVLNYGSSELPLQRMEATTGGAKDSCVEQAEKAIEALLVSLTDERTKRPKAHVLLATIKEQADKECHYVLHLAPPPSRVTREIRDLKP
jgi:hypothetical protein